MPEEGIQLRDKKEFMSSEEVVLMAKTFVDLGVNKIRLTGGEPLIKKDAPNIIRQLGALPVELTLTTNAVNADRFISVFKEAGIKSLNVSIDSLKPEVFNQISRRNFADKIISNINLLLDEGFKIKLNVVLIKGTNDSEIIDFIEFTEQRNVEIRFIEFMPFDGNNWNWDKKVSFDEIISISNKHFGASQIESLPLEANHTSKNFRIKGYQGSFGIISTLTNPFCDTCNRIRLTADGKIKNCLFSNDEIDLLSLHRKGFDVKPYIIDSIYNKKKARAGIDSFSDKNAAAVFSKNRSMTTIGG
jgi:molybdenum cofactor biosynthesis protein A